MEGQTMDSARLLSMYERMLTIRKFEERVYYLFLEGVLPGTIHQSIGQEATAVGMTFDLRPSDYMTSTHRPAAHSLAKGVSLRAMMCEMFAKSEGCCHGYGGAMHTGDIRVGAIPAIAIVGGGTPVAVGAGLSCKMRKTDDVVVCFLGDGANNEGAFHEAMNGAAIWDLPVIFACENNLYGASTRINMMMKPAHIADRAAAYGMPGEIVDGNDVLAVNEAAGRAVARARAGGGPALLELLTYRRCGHSRNDACGYRSKDEEKEWFAKCPIAGFRAVLLRRGTPEDDLLLLEKRVDDAIEREVEYARAAPSPSPEDAFRHVFTDM